jgi:hypothetical protein
MKKETKPMTEEQYVIVTNKTLLMSMDALLRDVIADDSGEYGITAQERTAIAKAIDVAMERIWKSIPKGDPDS